jgi:predicted nuclease of predicted toxin-antitoxin system
MPMPSRGIDVTTPQEVGLRGAADEAHLAFAHTASRVVITHDTDFLDLAARNVPHGGIVFCHNHARTVGQMVRSLEALWLTQDAPEMLHRVEFI